MIIRITYILVYNETNETCSNNNRDNSNNDNHHHHSATVSHNPPSPAQLLATPSGNGLLGSASAHFQASTASLWQLPHGDQTAFRRRWEETSKVQSIDIEDIYLHCQS